MPPGHYSAFIAACTVKRKSTVVIPLNSASVKLDRR
jgi:hypothetical protein